MSSSVGHVRWCLKKAARRAVAYGAWLTRRCHTLNQVNGGTGRTYARVLTYHGFRRSKRDPFAVSPGEFELQMAYLAERDMVASLDELGFLLEGNKLAGGPRVVVTIDDGLQSLYSEALPILRRYTIPAVAFVTVGEIGIGPAPRHYSRTTGSEPFLTPKQLESIAEAGVIIGSHAWTHRPMGRLPPAEVEEEAARSREVLERFLGRPVTSFAYPFGTRADFNNTTRSILEHVGYRYAFTSQHMPVVSGMDALSLGRIKVEGGEGMSMFRLLAHGGLDGWRRVDQCLWRFQASVARSGKNEGVQ